MIKSLGSIFIIVALLLAGCSSPEPEATRNLTDPDEHLVYFHDYLNKEIEDWDRNLGIDVHIVVIEEKGENIVSQVQQIFQQRNIGGEAKTGGVLIVLNPTAREARIAVSHNLEAVFTDDIVGAIAKSQLSPYASYNMAGMATMDTMHFLKDHLLARVAQGVFELDEYYRERPGNRTILGFYSGGGGGSAVIPDIDFNQNWKQKPADNVIGKYLAADTPEESVNAYSLSLRDGIGYPELSLFTPGSQIMQHSYPFAPYEAYLRHLRIEQSRPLSIKVDNDRAIALSVSPAHGYHPVMLHKIDGKWRVDQSEMMKNMFFDGKGNFYQKNKNHPYHFALKDQYARGSYKVASLALPDELGLQDVIHALKQLTPDSMRMYLVAELLFKNAFAAMEALEYYEKAVKLSPEEEFYRKKLIKRYQYLGMDSLALKHAMFVEEYRKYIDNPLEVKFIPEKPVFNINDPAKVGKTTVYDHSEFTVKITNRHFLPMRIISVDLTSIGNVAGQRSGLGDIINYWNWGKSGEAYLGANRTTSFNKVWGFTIDTPNTEMTYEYVFTYIIGNNPEPREFIAKLKLRPVES